ncbi:MAG: M28 family peptidase [Flavobacteriaceae bacterium]|jgi:hypothetical protein|nr:M28 family peptidase [Flavobacteriaceae bacterium]
MKKIFFAFFLSVFGFFYAQTSRDYAKQVISTLSSPELSGRGYVDGGMEKAAEEIVSQFEKIGVQKFNNAYFQTFTYPVNIIESSSLKINNKELRLGSDYLVGAGSPSLTANYDNLRIFKTSVIDSLFLSEENSYLDKEMNRIDGHVVVFPQADFPENLISDNSSAQQFYSAIPQMIADGSMKSSIPLIVELTSAKFIHTISPIQTQTVDLFVKNDAVSGKIQNIDVDIKSRFEPVFQAQNVVGFIKGQRSDSLIVLTAHYDHLGKISDVIFPGANDNASGIALILSLAKIYSKEKPKFDMVFIAFSGEEAGLKGSQYFVSQPLIDLKKIKFLINFDMVGTGEEGIQVVNGREFPKQFAKLETVNYNYQYVKEVKIRGAACNSDQCPFYEKGVPSFFVYTLGGSSAYHDINDTSESPSLYAFNKLTALFVKFINQL